MGCFEKSHHVVGSIKEVAEVTVEGVLGRRDRVEDGFVVIGVYK